MQTVNILGKLRSFDIHGMRPWCVCCWYMSTITLNLKELKTKKFLHYVFRSHLQPSSRPRELYTCLCIFVYGSLGREDGCRYDRNT